MAGENEKDVVVITDNTYISGHLDKFFGDK